MKRMFNIFLMGLLALVGVTGCGNDTNGDGIELTWLLSTGSTAERGKFNDLVERYYEQTGITVNIIEVPSGDRETKIQSMLLSDEPIHLAKTTGVDLTFIDRILPLNDIYDEFDFFEGHEFRINDGEDVVGLMIGLSSVGLILNTDLWEQAGVEFPTSTDEAWSWHEFLGKLEEVIDHSDAQYGMVMDGSEHRLRAFLYQWGVTGYNEDFTGTYYGSELMREPLEFFVNMNDDRIMPRSVWLGAEDSISMFKTGRIAAHMSTIGRIADYNETVSDFNWQAVSMPYEVAPATNHGGNVLISFNETGLEEETKDFIRWLYTDDYPALLADFGWLPALEGFEDIEYPFRNEDWQVYLNETIIGSEMSAHDKMGERWDLKDSGWNQVNNVIIENVRLHLSGDITMDEVLENISNTYREAGFEVLSSQ